ncbi:MAG TPA: hypothetical protein VKU19_25820 [Bryobacteraceae bacterium]|nr:hypothetical protein [Bryobacteraceae bacterium]
MLLVLILVAAASAAVVDRVAVVVGKTVITESEVVQEVRLTEFQNGQPLDLGPQQRRDAAGRLVDQQLIRSEMAAGSYPKPTPGDAQAVLQKFRQEHYPSAAEFQAALTRYGITEQQLQEHLLWQLSAVRFADLRFPEISEPASADRQAPSGDQQMDAWLKDSRSQVRIQFRNEAFQ